MSSAKVHHPVFARFYTRFSGFMEREVGRYREQLLSDLAGRVLEVGAGNGMNFPHYGAAVEEVVALEPEPYLRAQAARAAQGVETKVTIVEGTADSLPFEQSSFDAVVFCLVLCSVDDPAVAIDEAKRVLKPGGTLRFFEHVQSSRPGKARFQGVLDRSGIWPTIAGGCHCCRDTAGEIRSGGFEVTEMRDMPIGPEWGHTSPHILGRATPEPN